MIELFTIPSNKIKVFFDWAAIVCPGGFNLNIDDGCIWYCNTDTANVMMLYVKLQTNVANKAVIQVDPSKLNKTVTGDEVTYYKNDNKIVYKTTNAEHNFVLFNDEHIKTRDMPTVEKVKWVSTITILKEDLNKIFAEVFDYISKKKDHSDHIIFKIEDNILTIENSEVDEHHKYIIPLIDGNFEDCCSRFSIDMLLDALKYYKEFEQVTISLGNNMPVKFRFEDKTIEVETFIAPRIESN